MCRIFNESEKEFVIKNYHCMTNKQIVDVIGHTERQVRGYANGAGLKKEYLPDRLTDSQKAYIHEWYNVIDTGSIAKEVGLTTKQVNDYGYKNIGKRNIERYCVNEEYFKVIDTEQKAYWLGFLYADGCVTENNSRGYIKAMTMELGLSIKDVTHLDKFNNSTSSNYTIKRKTVTLNGNKYEACRVTICNTNFCKFLISKGCTPRKSLSLIFPNEDIVPKSLIRHFIRGYFDGDGCVCYASDKAKSKHYIYGFVGTMDILNNIQSVLCNEIGATKTKISEKGNAFQCSWGGRNNCVRFYEYIYKDATIWLDEKFNKIINHEV